MSEHARLADHCGDIDVSVTLVSTNERHYLDAMLPQLYRASDGVNIEVLLVDNACTDGSGDLGSVFPELKVICNDTRLRFSASHNRAIRQSRGRYLLCLNPDVLFERDTACIRKMVEFMDRRPECGVSGCRAHGGNGEFAYPARRFQTLKIVLARRLERVFGSEKTIDHYFYRDRKTTGTFEAEWLSGCFLFMRREALQQVGLFDSCYVKYFEDVDICRRIAAHGWRVLYYGQTQYTHLEQRASKALLSEDAWLHLQSWIRWLLRQTHYRRIDRQHQKLPARHLPTLRERAA